MKKIFIQELKNYNATNELSNIGFDSLYLKEASNKYQFKTLKIFNLKAIEANILKQTALSVGSDCAVHKKVILNADGKFDVLLCATVSNLQKIAEKLKMQQFRLKEIAKHIEDTLTEKNNILKIRDTEFDFNKNKYIMGILNITPDSFSDGGKYFDSQSVNERYLQLISDGADIIDIGAQSTRPNHNEIESEEEIKRLNLLFQNDEYKNSKIVKSIDTYKYEVAKYAIENGIDIINDVTGFIDKNMIKLAVDFQKPIVVTFNQKHQPPSNKTTFDQMYEFFVSKIDELVKAGIKQENIILDCGFGFLKNNDENIVMLNNLTNLTNLKLPILLGVSRKSFLQNFECNMDIDEISAIVSFKFLKNINILRVHDVKKHKELIKLSF